ncbi:MAG: AI-2E family transporter [Sulfurovum sp.]|jgi:predicted PurR-regulated permease PerM
MEDLDKNIVLNDKNPIEKVYRTNFQVAFYFLAFMFLVIYSLSNLSNILAPIAISILIWFLINSLANTLKKLPYLNSNLGNKIAIPFSVVVIFITIFIVGNFIASSLVELSGVIVKFDSRFNLIIEKLSLVTGLDIPKNIENFLEQFSIASVLNNVLGAFSSILSNSIQIILYVLFLLIDQAFFNSKLNALFPNYEARQKAKEVLNKISKTISTYISITTLISLFTGFLTYLICEYFSLEGAVLWGFVAFLFNFIPTIGSIIAVLFPVLFSIIQFELITDVLFLLLVLVVIQFIIGNILYPKLMGSKLNISQFVVIFSLVIWGAMWGTVGMFLSVPLMMIILIILSQFENTKAIAILISADGKI